MWLQDMVKRLLAGLLTLWVVVTLTFVLIRTLPGGPFQDPKVPPEIQAKLEAKYLLDRPLVEQYTHFMGQLAQGDLGPSLTSESRTVTSIVGKATYYSALIGVPALILGTLFGIILGTWAGLTPRPWLDRLLAMLGMASISMPSFIFGGLLVLVFSVALPWFPAATAATPRHLVLPVLALSLVPFAYALLLTRTAVSEQKDALYVMTKRSFGLPADLVRTKHLLRNSLLPLLSILGPMAAAIITGSFAVEFIFAIPGLGKYFVTSILNRDYTVVMGITLVFSVALVVFNTLTDMAMGLLDPRLREEGASS